MSLIEQIGKCRDILLTKDLKTVLKNIYLFEDVCNRTQRQVNKYTKTLDYELEFNYHDLKELAEEIFDFVKNYQTKFLFEYGQKELSKNKIITNDILNNFNQAQCDIMYVDRKLREAYKIISYVALIAWLWTEQREQMELDWQVTQTIRSFL
jgi:hypothetical protein